MKKLLYSYKSIGKYNIEFEIFVDINREFTDNDNRVAYDAAGILLNGIMEETYNLDPENIKKGLEEKTNILSLFGDRSIFVEEIPNEFCSSYCCKHKPWYIVTTNKGRIKIGWRKRVIEINWNDSIIKEDAFTLFPNEDVTKFDKTIHAWGLDKAKEYINKLLL